MDELTYYKSLLAIIEQAHKNEIQAKTEAFAAIRRLSDKAFNRTPSKEPIFDREEPALASI